VETPSPAVAAYLRAAAAWERGDRAAARRAAREALAAGPGAETAERARWLLGLLAPDPVALVAGVTVGALVAGLLAAAWGVGS